MGAGLVRWSGAHIEMGMEGAALSGFAGWEM